MNPIGGSTNWQAVQLTAPTTATAQTAATTQQTAAAAQTTAGVASQVAGANGTQAAQGHRHHHHHGYSSALNQLLNDPQTQSTQGVDELA